jgi:hypothetical protein
VTPQQRIHELIMCPLERCYTTTWKRKRRLAGGYFLTAEDTARLSSSDAAAREQLIATYVERLRGRR